MNWGSNKKYILHRERNTLEEEKFLFFIFVIKKWQHKPYICDLKDF